MKKFLIMLLLLFLCGLISGDVVTTGLKEESYILGIEVYKEYANTKQEFDDVFWQVLFERCKVLCFSILLFLTPVRERLPLLLAGLLAFCMGFFTMSNIISLGIVGLLVALAIFLPIILFYGGIMLILYGRRNDRRYHQGEKILYYGITCLLTFLLFVTGCIIETMIGIHLIPWMIRLSLI